MKTGELGRKIIVFYEQINDGDLSEIGYQPKMDCLQIWTCGVGHALKDTNGSWLRGSAGYKKLLILYPDLETMDEEEVMSLLEEDLIEREEKLDSLGLDLTQNEYDALISLIFNIGFGGFFNSTLLRRIRKRDGDIEAAFLMWNKGGGKVLRGLTLRRQTEATLFLTGELIFGS